MPPISRLLLLALWAGVSGCSQLLPAPAGPEVTATQQAVAAPQQQSLPTLSDVQQQQFAQAKQALQQGDFSAAATQLTSLYNALPQAAGIGYNLALAQWQNGDAQQAQQTLAQLVVVAGHYAAAHNLAGVLARQQGHFRQAERHFQRALQADAGYAIAHKNLAFLYELYLGQLLQAHYHYQQYFTLTQDEQAKIWLALLQQQLEQHDAEH